MPLPPYQIEEKPSDADRAIVAIGTTLIGFAACLIVGWGFVELFHARIFGVAGWSYGAIAVISGIMFVRKKNYRGFAVGIFCASIAWLFLIVISEGFSQGYWK